jgi:hypothetical protein
MSVFRYIPFPIGKTRLFISIFMALVSGFFIYFGSTYFRWLTLTRVIYFLFGARAILLFGTRFGYFHFNFNIVDVVGPASGIIVFSFFIGVFVLMKSFQRTISRLLANIDTSKLALST